MNYKDYLIFDLETTSKYADTTQPVQLAAVVVHGRKLEIKSGSEFSSLIRPVFDEEECRKLNLDPLTDESIGIHGKTRAMLEQAPSLKSVWSNFVEYVNQHNFNKSSWSAPIPVGYNIIGFDLPIVNRICGSEPWKYGPWDEKFRSQGVFNPIHKVDMMDIMSTMMENNKEVNSLSMKNLVRGYMGYQDKVGYAHDAFSDVLATAELFCRTQRLIRKTSASINWKDSLK